MISRERRTVRPARELEARGTGRRFAGKVCPSYARAVVSCAKAISFSLSLSLSLAGRTDKGRLRRRTATGLNERTWWPGRKRAGADVSIPRDTARSRPRLGRRGSIPARFCSLMTVRH